MNKKVGCFLLTLIFGCLLFFVLGSVFFYLSLQNNSQILLYKESGEVSYKSETGTYQKLLDDSISIKDGSYIKTGDGYAHVIFADNSMMSLDQNTEVQILVENDSIDIMQLVGNTWHRVQTLTQGKSYQVDTQNAIAAVRGTKFAIEKDREDDYHTNIYSIEDSVSTTGKPVGKIDAIGTAVDISEGYYAFIYTGSEIETKSISKEIQNSSWFTKNYWIDQIYDNYIDKGFDYVFSKIKDYEYKYETSATTSIDDYYINQNINQINENNPHGAIEGPLSYPSDMFPENFTVCAESEDESYQSCTENLLQDSKYQSGYGYLLDLPEGNYYVYSYDPASPDYYAYYTDFVACGMHDSCTSHRSILVQVVSGETTGDIEPGDWYND